MSVPGEQIRKKRSSKLVKINTSLHFTKKDGKILNYNSNTDKTIQCILKCTLSKHDSLNIPSSLHK